MEENTPYEEAVAELHATHRALTGTYPGRVVNLSGQWPAVAELFFEEGVSDLRLRLIDLDFGSWSFSIIRPKGGIRPLVHHAIWTGRRLQSNEKLPVCPGCGTYSAHECWHAQGFAAVYTEPKLASSQVRATLIRFLNQSRQSTA